MLLGSGLLTTSDAVTKWLTQDFPVSQVWCLRTVFVLVPIVAPCTALWWLSCSVTESHRASSSACCLVPCNHSPYCYRFVPFAARSDGCDRFFKPNIYRGTCANHPQGTSQYRRWLAIGIGFIGVLVILRPDPTTIGISALIAVTASLSSAVRDLVTRQISRTESSLSILFCSTLLVIVIALAAAPWLGWIAVPPLGWVLLLINGILNGTSHFLIIEALRLGEASVVSPYKYSALIWGAMLGFVIWGDMPNLWVIGGGMLIVASGLYLLREELR